MQFETRDLALIDRANERLAAGEFQAALCDLDQALGYVSTPHAHWNRSQVLLTLGDYEVGFAEHEWRWQLFTGLLDAEGKRAAGCAPLWLGQPLAGKRLLVYHECGYGDTIMMLRYLPQLTARGANVTALMPLPLLRLAAQFAPVMTHLAGRYDYRCPVFTLPYALQETAETVPSAPYLQVNPRWCPPLNDVGRKKVGICWSSERPLPVERSIGLEELVAALPDRQLYSLQLHGQDEAERHGVYTFNFANFAEVAALMMRMDAIVSIDTAALNLAGAIGHQSVNALLPFAPVWRWHNPRWYPRIWQCRQDRSGDWASALAKLRM